MFLGAPTKTAILPIVDYGHDQLMTFLDNPLRFQVEIAANTNTLNAMICLEQDFVDTGDSNHAIVVQLDPYASAKQIMRVQRPPHAPQECSAELLTQL